MAEPKAPVKKAVIAAKPAATPAKKKDFEVPTDGNIYVADIIETTDKESKKVRLSQYSEKSAEENVTGALMKGHSKFNSQISKRTLYASVSNENIADWKLEIGTDFAEAAFNGKYRKTMALRKVETLTPRVWKDADGNIIFQKPKTAGAGGDILAINEKPIYQNIELSLKGDEDVTIAHNERLEFDEDAPHVDPIEGTKAIKAAIKRKNSDFTEDDLAMFNTAETPEENIEVVDDEEVEQGM